MREMKQPCLCLENLYDAKLTPDAEIFFQYGNP